MTTSDKFLAAAVQAAPVFYDLERTVAKGVVLIERAAEAGCKLIAFGEAWLPGYPFHIWLGAPAWGMQYVQRYHANSVDLTGAAFGRIKAAARRCGIHVAIGYSERDNGSLYLGQALIDDTGAVLNARRKLKPTHVERSVFGEGYGVDLAVTDTALGRIGALCCWEHLQPLSKYALYGQGEQIHIAAWPAFSLYKGAAYALGAEVNMAASRVYAVEGQSFVIAATNVVDADTLEVLGQGPDSPPFLQRGGGSAMIFGPDGRELAEFLPETAEGLVIAEIDLGQITLAKAVADPAGHYSKPESTRMILDKRVRPPLEICEDLAIDEPPPDDAV
jgi:aliphatic nitrilase